MAKKMTQRQIAVSASQHHATLNAFYAVIAVLEGGTVCDPQANATSQRIIALCKQESARQLKRFDAALEKIKD